MSAESKTNDDKLALAKQAADRERLLQHYEVRYNRRTNEPELVMKNGMDLEAMPEKDVQISVFTGIGIIVGALYLWNFQEADLTEVAMPGAAFNFTTKQKEFYVDAYMNWVFLIASCLFLPTVFKLRAIMKHRPAFELRNVLFVWNMIASGLSGWAMVYVVPELLEQVDKFGVQGMLCKVEYCWSRERIGIYVFIYQTTKALEWIDTALLALRKKPMVFLHLFHHIVTMLYCWHAAFYSSTADCTGIWFAGMNLVVHFIMYGYYGIMALNIKAVNTFLRKISFMITILQTVQMVVGTYILISATLNCEATWTRNWHGVLFCGVMYGTYLFLFSRLVIVKFTMSKEMSKKKKKDNKKKGQ